MNPLQTRKQLLVAQCELDRAMLLQDLGEWQGRFRTVADRAQTWVGIAASLVGLAATVVALTRAPASATRRSLVSWREFFRRSVAMISKLWGAAVGSDRDRPAEARRQPS